MKKLLFGFIAGVILSSSVSAIGATVIKSASYNTNKIIYNGKELSLDKPMISVVDTGSDNASNYMPVRAVLEAMGYAVDWDAAKNAVVVNDSGDVKTSNAQPDASKDTYIDQLGNEVPNGYLTPRAFVDKYNVNGGYDNGQSRFEIYDENGQTILDIPAIVINQSVYIKEQDGIDALQNNSRQ